MKGGFNQRWSTKLLNSEIELIKIMFRVCTQTLACLFAVEFRARIQMELYATSTE